MAGSLTDDQLLAPTGQPEVVTIIPDANAVKIGGRAPVFPLIDGIVANLPRHKILIGAGCQNSRATRTALA